MLTPTARGTGASEMSMKEEEAWVYVALFVSIVIGLLDEQRARFINVLRAREMQGVRSAQAVPGGVHGPTPRGRQPAGTTRLCAECVKLRAEERDGSAD